MSQLRKFIKIGLLFLCLSALVLAAGCGHNKMEHGYSITEGELIVVDAFARAAIPGSSNSAAYMVVLNGLDNEVTLTNVDTTAASADLHETVRDENDLLRMKPYPEGIEIPARSALIFEPGGKHIMLVDLQAPFDAGSEIEMTFHFDGTNDQTLIVPVKSMQDIESKTKHDH